MPQFYIEFKEYEENSKFKIFKVMKLTFKTRASHFLLSITFNDKFRKSHVGILYIGA